MLVILPYHDNHSMIVHVIKSAVANQMCQTENTAQVAKKSLVNIPRSLWFLREQITRSHFTIATQGSR